MKIPQKPESKDEQVSMIWDALYNHVFHKLKWQDIKITFILVFVGLLLAAFGILAAMGIVG